MDVCTYTYVICSGYFNAVSNYVLGRVCTFATPNWNPWGCCRVIRVGHRGIAFQNFAWTGHNAINSPHFALTDFFQIHCQLLYQLSMLDNNKLTVSRISGICPGSLLWSIIRKRPVSWESAHHFLSHPVHKQTAVRTVRQTKSVTR